jgi:hypothetical protein
MGSREPVETRAQTYPAAGCRGAKSNRCASLVEPRTLAGRCHGEAEGQLTALGLRGRRAVVAAVVRDEQQVYGRDLLGVGAFGPAVSAATLHATEIVVLTRPGGRAVVRWARCERR